MRSGPWWWWGWGGAGANWLCGKEGKWLWIYFLLIIVIVYLIIKHVSFFQLFWRPNKPEAMLKHWFIWSIFYVTYVTWVHLMNITYLRGFQYTRWWIKELLGVHQYLVITFNMICSRCLVDFSETQRNFEQDFIDFR